MTPFLQLIQVQNFCATSLDHKSEVGVLHARAEVGPGILVGALDVKEEGAEPLQVADRHHAVGRVGADRPSVVGRVRGDRIQKVQVVQKRVNLRAYDLAGAGVKVGGLLGGHRIWETSERAVLNDLQLWGQLQGTTRGQRRL
eukprot:gnl/Hemi2/25362_TR8539_c0_g4_i1.p1 gnl/Hemi2/25362_TR8539_c0_g4~~gnl/Hemi2/25362_TR8539_c0_g4_i1.p1  ORF type:complete len:150 (+),score=5.50 gnl/Hemi2/25362_TR8539_c0_g4_i1:26-451(+)